MKRARLTGGLSAFCLCFLATASAAAAASRYASPSGTGTACTQAQPCDIATAVNSAGSGDDVTVEPGTYVPSGELINVHTISVHGQAGQPRPVIQSAVSLAFAVAAPNTSVSDLEIDAAPGTSNDGLLVSYQATNATLDRLLIRASASLGYACDANASVTITNTLCETTGDSGADGMILDITNTATSGTMILRNDTIENTGGTSLSGGDALLVGANSGDSNSVTLSNSIARGTANDIHGFGAGTTTLTADHSNYGSVFGSGGSVSITPAGSGTNQTNSPQFVNSAVGDFHELGTSPTVNAGADASANGQLDLDGNPREFGAATDIGAYEYIPPPTCQPVNATTATGTPVTVQLTCTDALGGPVTYAITANPAHGSVSLNAATGQATFTPSGGYTGPDSFSFNASSGHGTGASATASITVTAASTAPRDSKPRLSPTAFMPFASGPSIIAAKSRGTLISYTDTQSATTVFKVQRAVGTGVLSHGKCVKASSKRKGRKCTRYQKVGRFKHADSAGLNRFRFTGRVGGKKLRPGHYRLISRPVNTAGKAGPSHTNFFTIIR